MKYYEKLPHGMFAESDIGEKYDTMLQGNRELINEIEKLNRKYAPLCETTCPECDNPMLDDVPCACKPKYHLDEETGNHDTYPPKPDITVSLIDWIKSKPHDAFFTKIITECHTALKCTTDDGVIIISEDDVVEVDQDEVDASYRDSVTQGCASKQCNICLYHELTTQEEPCHTCIANKGQKAWKPRADLYGGIGITGCEPKCDQIDKPTEPAYDEEWWEYYNRFNIIHYADHSGVVQVGLNDHYQKTLERIKHDLKIGGGE